MIDSFIKSFNSKIYYNKDIFYIKKGVVQIFYYNMKGQKQTHWISSDNSFITIFSSLLSKQEVPYGIEVIESESEIIRIPYSKIIQMKNESDEFQTLFENLLIKNLIRMGNRLVDIQTKSTKLRYGEFVKTNSDLLQRINLGYIASYLGMTQQQLSKIRTQKL